MTEWSETCGEKNLNGGFDFLLSKKRRSRIHVTNVTEENQQRWYFYLWNMQDALIHTSDDTSSEATKISKEQFSFGAFKVGLNLQDGVY